MDDLLHDHGLHLTGPAAISVVAISHSDGLVLYPIDPSQQTQGEQQGGLQTAAAFVPQDLLGSDSDSEEEEGRSG